MSSFAIILNGLLLVVFAVDPLRCLRNISSYLIINIALADLVTGTAILIWTTQTWPWLSFLCEQIVLSSIWLGYTVSFLTITLLSCERFIAIKYIWSANRIVTKQRTMYAIIIIWLISCSSFVLISPTYRQIYILSLSTFFEFCVIVVVIFYVKLWRTRRSHSQQESAIAVRQEMKLTVVVFILLVILVFTTLPLMFTYQIIILASLICKTRFCLGKALHSLPLQLFPVFAINFSLNPVIYAWRLPKYRRSFYLLCSMLFQNITHVQRPNNSESRRYLRSNVALSQFTSGSSASIQISQEV